MKHFKKAFVLISFCLVFLGNLITTVKAQDPIILTDKQDKYPLGLHLEILEDPTNTLTIEQVSSPQYNTQFIPNKAEVPNFGFTNSDYWVRFKAKNNSTQATIWWLEMSFANMHYIDFYFPSPNQSGFEVQKSGALLPFNTRKLAYSTFVFNLPLPPQTEQILLGIIKL